MEFHFFLCSSFFPFYTPFLMLSSLIHFTLHHFRFGLRTLHLLPAKRHDLLPPHRGGPALLLGQHVGQPKASGQSHPGGLPARVSPCVPARGIRVRVRRAARGCSGERLQRAAIDEREAGRWPYVLCVNGGAAVKPAPSLQPRGLSCVCASASACACAQRSPTHAV